MTLDNFLMLRTSVTIDGKTWNLFSADYENSDGKFSFYFHAISFDHARIVLQDIKDTAVLSGQVGGFVQRGTEL